MKRQQGITLVEILVVISILIILTTILLPVAKGVKARAKVSSSQARLRQIYVAASLYQQDWSTGVSVGNASQLGLPTFSGWVQNWLDLDDEVRKSPCQGMNPYRGHYTYLWAPDDAKIWVEFLEDYGDQMYMVQDRACNDSNVEVSLNVSHKFGLAVFMNGSIKVKSGIGDWGDPRWWGATKGE